MNFFKIKYVLIALVSFLIFGCNNDDNNNNNNQNSVFEVKITDFLPSYSQVKINWEIVTKPREAVIQEVLIYRKTKNDDSDVTQEELIATLLPDATEFTDYDVPYKSEITYKVKINYFNQSNPISILNKESDQKKFVRDIIKFDRVPFQVQKDPLQNDIFHILEQKGIGFLKRYNSNQNQLTNTKSFTNGTLLNNKFQIIDNSNLYLADTQGKIYKINSDNYETAATYSTAISDNLNAFAVDGDRIYYQDEEIWKYYTISNNTSTSGNIGTAIDYSEPLGNNNFLFLYSQNGSSAAAIQNYTTTNCNSSNCFPSFGVSTQGANLGYNAIDPNIFTWNATKSKFITSVDGRIFNISNLQQEAKLSDITGKKYFQFYIDNANNIYATVQGEKKIHKFNSSLQLVEVINTKLYPLFPMITTNGLKVIGAYEPVLYYSFGYGYNFIFNIKCAVEILP